MDRLLLAQTRIKDVNVRDASATGDGSWTIDGYAAVYEQETTLWEVPGWVRVKESIALGALTDVIGRANAGDELVHLNHGHDMKTAVAATDVQGIGGLELRDDSHGMGFFARVDPEDPDARSLAVKLRRRVVAQASFAFTIEEERESMQELDDGTEEWTFRIMQVGHLYDVCCAAQGAYAQTESHIRTLASASLRVPDLGALGRSELPDDLRRRIEGGRGRRDASASGGDVVAPETAGQVASLSLLRARAADRRRRFRVEGVI